MNRLYICSVNDAQYRTMFETAALPGLALTDSLEQANIVLADPPRFAKQLEQATQLAWLQSTFAGADALLAKPKKNYQLTNVRGIFGPLMSEYVFGQLLTLTRHLPHYRAMQSEKRWQPKPYQGLHGKHLVILGTGSIGAHLAATGRHFGMQVTGVSRSGEEVEGSDRVVTTAEMHEALGYAHVVVSVLPSTSETSGILSHETLSHCQQAILFNVGRGSALVEADLPILIEQGHIAHAVLDVFTHEPLDTSHPFWRHPAITVTPHISAESFPEQVFEIFAENYRRWRDGKPLNFVMDFSRGY